MKTITVRGIEEDLSQNLKQMAQKEGKSVNQIVLDALREYSGLHKRKRFSNIYHDLDQLFGRWSREELERIQGKIDAARKIDPELWQ